MKTAIKTKKPVPYKWYKECCNELARDYMESKARPAMQQRRIDAVIESGLDHEVMGNGMIVPLEKLRQFLADALSVDCDAKMKAYRDFKEKYEGIKGLEGNLRAAKIEAELKKLKRPSFYDGNDYGFYSSLINKHYLSNKQADELMAYFMNIGIL